MEKHDRLPLPGLDIADLGSRNAQPVTRMRIELIVVIGLFDLRLDIALRWCDR